LNVIRFLCSFKTRTDMRRIALIAFTTFICQLSFSQPKFGVKAGPNLYFPSVAKKSTQSYDNYKVGYVFGASLDLKASEKLTIQPELNYMWLHAVERFSEADIQYSNLVVPVLLKYRFKDIGFGAYVGPQLNFVTSAKSKTPATNSKDIKNDLNNMGVAGVLGVDYITSKNIRLDFRIQQNFFGLYKTEYGNQKEVKGSIASFTIGYLFNKK
jgi:Outer membrane protein beta-barrel domain